MVPSSSSPAPLRPCGILASVKCRASALHSVAQSKYVPDHWIATPILLDEVSSYRAPPDSGAGICAARRTMRLPVRNAGEDAEEAADYPISHPKIASLLRVPLSEPPRESFGVAPGHKIGSAQCVCSRGKWFASWSRT